MPRTKKYADGFQLESKGALAELRAKKEARKGTGPGRPKGSTDKLSGRDILRAIQHRTGRQFTELLADGYAQAIESRDTMLRFQYEKIIVAKCVADDIHLEVSTTRSEAVAQLEDATIDLAAITALRNEELIMEDATVIDMTEQL